MKELGVAAILLLAVHTAASAQTLEAAPLTTFVTSISLDQTAIDVDELTINEGWGWGARGSFFVTERIAIEGIWTYRETPLEMQSGPNTAEVLEITFNDIHANAAYHLRAKDARLNPFVFGGLGATIFTSDDIESETKLSWGVGGGVKWWLSERFGVEGRGRFKFIALQSDSDEYCGPFDFCQDSMQVFDVVVGVVIRF